MSATGGAGADAADLYTGRIFFVLFEAELWMYASKKDWKARTAPLDEVPLPLGKVSHHPDLPTTIPTKHG